MKGIFFEILANIFFSYILNTKTSLAATHLKGNCASNMRYYGCNRYNPFNAYCRKSTLNIGFLNTFICVRVTNLSKAHALKFEKCNGNKKLYNLSVKILLQMKYSNAISTNISKIKRNEKRRKKRRTRKAIKRQDKV